MTIELARKPRFAELFAHLGLSGADPHSGYQDTTTIARVVESADRVPLATLWKEFEDINKGWNATRLTLTDLVSYRTTVLAETVPQNITSDSFQVSTERGIPPAMRGEDWQLLGNDYADYDLRSAFTWRYLRDAPAEQIRQMYSRILESDAKLQAGICFQRLFSPTDGTNEAGHPVRGLYNGLGSAPPAYMGRSFNTSHSHYVASQATQIDSEDIEDAVSLITEHGYGRAAGSQLLILANGVQGEQIQSWRAGVESRPSSGKLAKFDFLPSASAPPRIQIGTIVGTVAPADLGGLPVAGSYGPGWLVETEYIPAGWVLVVASAGFNNPNNPLAIREHENPNYRGLRQIPGGQQGYPLIDMFATRGIGAGVRHRGAAVAIQVTAGSTYSAPQIAI